MTVSDFRLIKTSYIIGHINGFPALTPISARLCILFKISGFLIQYCGIIAHTDCRYGRGKRSGK